MRSIKTHLTVTLLLCILLPTGLIGAAAYWSVSNSIRENRIKDVGLIADARYEELRMRLHEYNERGKDLLNTVIIVCRHSDVGVNACARAKLEQFAAVNHAAGFTLHSGIENDLTVGNDAIPFDKINKPFLPGQIAATSKVNAGTLLSLIVVDSASGFSLVTSYPGQELQNIFVGSPVLGQSGETFLTDSQGFFITKSRYPSQQGILSPISAAPMQHCLRSESSETFNSDYRDVSIIHGFRYVPEIGGGCIMAHIDQAEAFAPLKRLVMGLSVAAFLFACSAWLIATLIGRNMTKPIVALTDMARALSQGDFTQRVSSANYHEINELSQLFNSMAGQLDSTLNRLKASEQELEKTVDKRTAELHERHRKYHSVIQSTGEGFWQIDREGRILEVNPAYVRLSGYSEEALVGMRITDLEARELSKETAGHIRNVMRKGADTFETKHRRKDGQLWDAEVNVSFISEDGGYFVAFFRDVTERKRIENSLLESHSLLQSVIDTVPVRIFWKDRESRYLGCNSTFARDTGEQSPQDVIGKDDFQLKAVEHAEMYRTDDHRVMEQGLPKLDFEESRTTADGRQIWLKASKIPLRNEADKVIGILGVYRDITEDKRIEQELRIAATAFETLEGITITDANEIIVRVNRAFTQITGYTPEEVIGRKPSILKSGHHEPGFYHGMHCALQNEGQWEGEIWDRHKDGHIYPKWLAITAVKDDLGHITHYVGNFTDITERKTSEEKIKNLAFYDTLTGLANRRLLSERLEHAIAILARTGHHGALLFLDLDNFKLLNDSQGHGVGDELLIEVAQRLKTSVREIDTVARLGGDEFIVLLEELGAVSDSAAIQVKTIAEKVVSALAEPYLLSSVVHNCSSSIGTVLFRNPAATADSLLAQADTAMYAAKKSGKNAYRFFDPAMQQELELRAKFESALRQAVNNEQFKLFYQPQVDDKQQMIGVEALVRWDHPELGLILPDQFIPVAEETDIILSIGRWVLETACAQLKTWRNRPLTQKLSIAVNVSPKQFYQPGFVDEVREIMVQYAIEPMQLKMELTESMVLKEIDIAIAKMIELKAIGIVLVMDDFGTGYSSLSYLKNLPFDQIKIDKSFMDGIKQNNNDAYIIHSVITLGRLMEIAVIAEGVEDSEQDELLKSLGCTVFQGYLFGRPVPVEELESQLMMTLNS
jgi:diguanylate cyclase (GGDEF)-like protein/PAS domain S-box-containing protein